MASTYLTRTMGSATSRFTFTLSMWVKRSAFGEEVFWNSYNSNNYRFQLYFDSSDRLVVYDVDNNVDIVEVVTNRKFRDLNAWYHIYVAVKVSESTASDRVKVYINGERETSFAVATYPSTSNDMALGTSTYTLNIGRYGGGTAYFSGYMSHSHYVDGSIIDVTEFGSTDSTTGEWKINTSPTISSYGNQGHFILKDGNSLTDQSGNSNNFTLGGGTLTKTEDCPSNVFCTWNPLNSYYGGGTFSWGNNKIVLPNKNGAWNTGTLGMTSGKYYWEIKVGGDANGGEVQVGIADKSPVGNQGSTAGKAFGYSSNGEYGIYAWNGAFIGNAVPNSYTAYGATNCEDGYIMIAVDLDNNKFYGGLNGTWFASGNPSTGTNGKTIQAVADTVDGVYYPAVSTFQGYSGTVETNFGNGYFADNAVSNPGTNASGNGIFKYAVPTGYTALSTKGLNL